MRELKIGAVSLIILTTITLILPLPTAVIDFLILISFALSFVFLIICSLITVERSLNSSFIPFQYIFLSTFRLALCIASTRLILGNGGYAGQIVRIIGGFFISNSLVFGVIVFVVIMIIQLLFVIKCAKNVSDVAMRYTQDFITKKQLDINPIFNSGVLQREAGFFSALLNACRFSVFEAVLIIIIALFCYFRGTSIGSSIFTDPAIATEIYTEAIVGSSLSAVIPIAISSFSIRFVTNNIFRKVS